MASVIPLPTDSPFFDIQVVLTGIIFTLEFHWNEREGSWYFNIQTEDGQDIINGVKVVVDFPLARRSPNPLRPAGVLVASDTTGKQQNPIWNPALNKSDLGDRVQLLYFEPGEL